MSPILDSDSRSKLVLAQSPWVDTPPAVPRRSAVRRWFQVAAYCVASFAAGWGIQAVVVPLFWKAPPIQAGAVLPSASEVKSNATVPPPVEQQPSAPAAAAPPVVVAAPAPTPTPTEAAPTPRPTADFVNRPRVRFVARLNATTSIAPGVELTVSQIEGQRLDADVRTAAGTIPVRSQSLLQIVPIDSASGRDLIFTAADEGSVTGYVLLPKP